MAAIKIDVVQFPGVPKPSATVLALIRQWAKGFPSYESSLGLPAILWYDERSEAFYTMCHLPGSLVASNADLEAVLDPEESEEYKLNREIYTDNYAYRRMESDALLGRSFEDIVVEFDESYRPKSPLKVFGGQHRIEAMKRAQDEKGDVLHGLRVYFGLTVEQKIDIAIVNNTSIAVSNDLLDRMQEDLLGTELRDWAQDVGLLAAGQGFADTRSSEGIPTVRTIRTFLVNFYRGRNAAPGALPDPYVCKSGPQTDPEYEAIRPSVDWKDKALQESGREFARLHAAQRDAVLSRTTDRHLEFANKCMHPSVVASWAYVAGSLQKDPGLAQHYSLAESSKPDPLNAPALSQARLKGVDPDTYRGLGARISPSELGRMVQLFLLQATKASKPGITRRLANAAIQSYEALKATDAAKKATDKI